MTALSELVVDRADDVAIAVSERLSGDVAGALAEAVAARLDGAGVPMAQQTWIVASAGNDERAARTTAAISDYSGGARLIIHDPRDLDGLVFERRHPGQRRGGVYLNARWQAASVRIVCGEPLEVARRICAWFNPPRAVQVSDLRADLVLR